MDWDDVREAAPGEERDALWRSLERDMTEVADVRAGGPGFVRASRPADVARALGRERRTRDLNLPHSLRSERR